MEKKSILFICNVNYIYGHYAGSHIEKKFSGLFNSASMVSDMLNANGFTSNILRVIDYNRIDAAVTLFKPDVAVIEALWVTPEKMQELAKLHPKIKWVVRIHSETPFLATEGIAMEWLKKYTAIQGVQIACNSIRTVEDIGILINGKVPYLPNYYPLSSSEEAELFQDMYTPVEKTINIGCFAAIRPMKNQLLQAMAAIKFATDYDYYLNFHINGTRVEQFGEPILRNLRSLFEGRPDDTLVEHEWESPNKFKMLLAKMDMGLQVSLSETFNIISADMVDVGIPIVVSEEVTWAAHECKSNATNVGRIVSTMHYVWDNKKSLITKNRKNLASFSENSQGEWINFLSSI